MFFNDTCPTKDIWCHAWPYCILCLQITKSDIRLKMKLAVSLKLTTFISLRSLSGHVWVNTLTLLLHGLELRRCYFWSKYDLEVLHTPSLTWPRFEPMTSSSFTEMDWCTGSFESCTSAFYERNKTEILHPNLISTNHQKLTNPTCMQRYHDGKWNGANRWWWMREFCLPSLWVVSGILIQDE